MYALPLSGSPPMTARTWSASDVPPRPESTCPTSGDGGALPLRPPGAAGWPPPAPRPAPHGDCAAEGHLVELVSRQVAALDGHLEERPGGALAPKRLDAVRAQELAGHQHPDLVPPLHRRRVQLLPHLDARELRRLALFETPSGGDRGRRLAALRADGRGAGDVLDEALRPRELGGHRLLRRAR